MPKFLKALSLGLLTSSLVFTACSKGRFSKSNSDLNVTATSAPGSVTSSVGPAPIDPTSVPTQGIIKSDFQANEVSANCDAAIAEVTNRLNIIAKRSGSDRTIDSTLLAYEAAMADFSDETTPLTFMGYVSKDEKINAEGSACEEKVGQFYVTVSSRKDLYNSMQGLVARNSDEQRLLSKTLEGFEQSGVKLDDATLAKVTDLKGQLSSKENKYSANLNADVSSVSFTKDELAGAPDSFVARLAKTADGKFIVTTKETDYSDLIQNASNSETRRKMQLAYLNRAADANTKLLEDAVVLRAQIAKALGYKTWADYRIEGRMAKDGTTVLNFLNDLKGKLAIRSQQDLDQLLKFKKELDPTATVLNQWDIPYYSYQLQKRDYSLDDEVIREYFPSEKVVAGIFDVYSELLGVKFVALPNAKVWADGVKLYEIHNASDNRLIGYFYADLIPRAGKYGHAAAFPLISGRMLAGGKYSLPVSSIVANLTPPGDGKPSLLTHDDVETFFHEFGHIMHQTLTRAPYASLSGSAVAQDFVEAPSQMLENWVWSPQILKKISGHYLRPQETLPQDLLEKMIAARNFQQGYAYTKQLLYALFDMTLHTQDGPVDSTKIYDDLYRQILGQEPLAGNHFGASFGHLMGGYDAGYYGYLWSEVYAQDMFSKFPVDNLTDPTVGARYRSTILEQGNMKDALDILKEFLGRDPSSEAFFKKLGL